MSVDGLSHPQPLNSRALIPAWPTANSRYLPLSVSSHAVAKDVVTWFAGRPAAAAAPSAAASSAGVAAYSTTRSANVDGVSGRVSVVQVPDGAPLTVSSAGPPDALERNSCIGS